MGGGGGGRGQGVAGRGGGGWRGVGGGGGGWGGGGVGWGAELGRGGMGGGIGGVGVYVTWYLKNNQLEFTCALLRGKGSGGGTTDGKRRVVVDVPRVDSLDSIRGGWG